MGPAETFRDQLDAATSTLAAAGVESAGVDAEWLLAGLLGVGRVEVRLRLAAGRAVVEIADTGIGIPAAEREHLFQRFFRTSNAQTIKGTGLGLTVAKAIAEGHGGSVSFESTEGVGTTFRVELPLLDELEQAA